MGRPDAGGTVADVTGDTQSYCTACGSAVNADALFCAQCGAPRQAAAPPATPGAAHAFPVVPVAEQAVALTGIGVSLPWQRLTADERPSPRDWVAAGALPSAQWAAGLSLKRPGLALAAATLLDFAVAIITGGASGLYEALPRLIFGGVTAGLAVAADSKRGRLRVASGVARDHHRSGAVRICGALPRGRSRRRHLRLGDRQPVGRRRLDVVGGRQDRFRRLQAAGMKVLETALPKRRDDLRMSSVRWSDRRLSTWVRLALLPFLGARRSSCSSPPCSPAVPGDAPTSVPAGPRSPASSPSPPPSSPSSTASTKVPVKPESDEDSRRAIGYILHLSAGGLRLSRAEAQQFQCTCSS